MAVSSLACDTRTASTQKVGVTPFTEISIDDFSIPSGWKRYSVGERPSFSLALPSKPESLTYDWDAKEKIDVYLSKNGLGVYGVSYLGNLTAAASRSEEKGSEFLFNIFIRPFALNIQNSMHLNETELEHQMLGQRMVEVEGVEALEWDFSLSHFQGRARLFRIGQAGICVVAIWEQTAKLNDLKTFFSSIRIVKRQ